MITTSSGSYANIKANAKFNWRVARLPYWRRRQGRAAEHDHRRRDAVGADAEGSRGLQGHRQVLHVPVVARNPGRLAPVDRLRADHDRRVRAHQEARVSTKRIRASTSRSASSPTSRPPPTRRACASATSSQIRNIIDEELEQVWNGQEDRQAGARRGGEARQRAAREVPEGEPVATRSAAAPAAIGGAAATRHGRSRRIPIALAAVRAGRAADRDHAGLLLLAGGAGALPVGAGAGRLRHADRSSSGSTISRRCSATRSTCARSGSPRCSRCWWPSSGSRSRCCSPCSPTASCAARRSTRRC